MRRRQSGFTIVELIIGLTVLGLTIAISAPLIDQLVQLNKAAKRNDQLQINQKIAAAMTDWMEQRSRTSLPVPYSGGGLQDAVVDIASTAADDVALLDLLTSRAIPVPQIYSNGTVTDQARIFQKVGGLTSTVSLYGLAGPSATLQYEIGAVYLSSCRRTDSSCYPSSSGVAGYSAKLEASNVTTWEIDPRDDALVRFSTLPIQQQRLARTRERLDRARDALRDYFSGRFLSGAPDPNINYFPAPTGSGAPNLAGADPSGNDGCRDGWYSLPSGNVNVLETVGLLKEEFGLTAWGGAIEYCRDFDPAGTSPEGEAPQTAAIRINRSVSTGTAPGAAGANLIFSI